MSQRFISENDIEAKKKELKEAWDAARGEDDPEMPPEEPPPDHRTLYHRLEEQKLKKQEEYDDAHRLKNMVRGLEDEEVQFLDMVDRSKMEQERRVRDEETSALSEFRKRRVEMEIARSSEIVSTASHTSTAPVNKTPKNSQKLLLSGAVKKKDSVEPSNKRRRTSSSNSSDSQSTNGDLSPTATENSKSEAADLKSQSNQNGDCSKDAAAAAAAATEGNWSHPDTLGPDGYLQCVGVLPGLGQYSDSSDSVGSSDDSDPDTRPRIVIKNKSRRKGCC